MRAQCCICQELFENDSELVISALQCGHTFHGECLNQWLESGSSTCPSCRQTVVRKRIIDRLFFDQPEEVDENADADRLQNEVDRLKAELRKRDIKRKNMRAEQNSLTERLNEMKKAGAETQDLLKCEQTKSSGLLKQLKYYESQQKSLQLEREECRRIKKKLVDLQSIETLFNGTESDASDIIATTGSNPNAISALSRQVAFLKREFEKVKSEKREMKNNYKKLEEAQINRKISEISRQNAILKDQLERSEGDLKLAEQQVEFLRKKVSRLKRAVSSPQSTTGSTSFVEAMNDSIQLSNMPVSTPKLERPANSQDEVDLNTSMDLFDSPVLKKTQVKRPLEEEQENRQTKVLKISSAAEKFANKKVTVEKNANWMPGTMNIFKKKVPGESDYTSVTRKGYDGLGGHSTFVNAKGNIFKKPTVKKVLTKNSKSTPALPTLHNFIQID